MKLTVANKNKMKNGRINERNIGSVTLEGEPKKRNRKTLTESSIEIQNLIIKNEC